MSYLNETGLTHLWSKITSKFATLGHKHTTADLTNYTVDTALSTTSTNPIQNKAIKTEFDSVNNNVMLISADIHTVKRSLDNKADTNHTHPEYIQQFSLVSDGNGNVTISGSSTAATAAEEVKF